MILLRRCRQQRRVVAVIHLHGSAMPGARDLSVQQGGDVAVTPIIARVICSDPLIHRLCMYIGRIALCARRIGVNELVDDVLNCIFPGHFGQRILDGGQRLFALMIRCLRRRLGRKLEQCLHELARSLVRCRCGVGGVECCSRLG